MDVFHLKEDGEPVKVTITDENLTVSATQDTKVVIQVDDIIAIDDIYSSSVDAGDDLTDHASLSSCVVHFIMRNDKHFWKLQEIVLTDGEDDGLQYFISKIRPLFAKCTTNRPKSLVFLLNPIGGKQQAQWQFDNVVKPILQLANVSWDLIVSQRQRHLIEVANENGFEYFDGIVVLGGDGTFCEVLNVLIRKEQEKAGIDINDPTAHLNPLSKPFGIIPTGTGNGKAETLYGCQDVITSLLHIIKGKTTFARIIAAYNEKQLIGFSGMLFGISYMADFLDFADNNLRFLRHLRYLVFPFWYMLQRKKPRQYEVTIYSRENTIYNDQGQQKIRTIEKQVKVKQSCVMLFCYWSRMSQGFYVALYDSISSVSMLRDFINILKRVLVTIPGITRYPGDAFRICVQKTGNEHQNNVSKTFKINLDGEIYNTKSEDYFVRTINDLVLVYSSHTQR